MKKLYIAALVLAGSIVASPAFAYCVYKYVWVRDAWGNWIYVYKYVCF